VFEQAIKELETKINGIKTFADEHGLDLSGEIQKLEAKKDQLAKEMFENLTPWDKVQIARHNQRPTTLDYIEHIFTDFIEMHGDRMFGDDAAIVGGIAKLEGKPITVIGNQKGRNTKENIARNFGMAHPEGYRKSIRLMKQANKFNRPVIFFINTAGAYPGKQAEERGQSEAIARSLIEMAALKVPVICVVTGEGGSGGALALGVGNRIFMLKNSFYSVISPEGAAALLWKDSNKAKQAAETMKITAEDLKRLGVIEDIIDEPTGGAHTDIQAQSAFIKETILKALKELSNMNPDELKQDRYDKFRKIGSYDFLNE
jgi:acetyl-CoA carboxylase carboxyl transferase subunit alpha